MTLFEVGLVTLFIMAAGQKYIDMRIDDLREELMDAKALKEQQLP